MKKKLSLALLVLGAAVGFALSFGSVHFLANTAPADVASIAVRDGTTGQSFVVTDSGDIAAIVAGLQAPAFSRKGISLGYTGTRFTLTFADQRGSTIAAFTVNSDTSIRKDPFFYRCAEGGLSAVVARLEGLAQTGGQVDEEPEPDSAATEPADQYAALRAQLAYPYADGLPQQTAPYDLSGLEAAEAAPQVYSLLYFAGDTGAYTSAAELGNTKKLAAGVGLAFCGWREFQLSSQFSEAADTLANAVEDAEFVPREWADQAAAQLWGPEVQLDHMDVEDDYIYHAAEGVYTPPHRSGVTFIPYLHTLIPDENGFLAKVSYVQQGEPGTYDPEADQWLAAYDEFDDPQLAALVQRLPRWLVAITVGENGSLTLASAQPITDQ